MRGRIPKDVRADAALACMVVAAIRFARAGLYAGRSLRLDDAGEDERDDRRSANLAYGRKLADIALDEIVDGAAIELAQRAREDYAVAASNGASNLWPRSIATTAAELAEIDEENARMIAAADGYRWAEAAALLLDGWSP